MLLLLDLHIAQHIILNSTVASTHHVSISKTSFFLNFKKYTFRNFLDPFPGSLRLLPLIFDLPYSRYISQHLFPNFDLHSHFLLHGTTKRLNSNLIRPSCTTPSDAQPVGPTHTLSTATLEAGSLTSTVTPTPPLYSFFSFSPKSMLDRSAPDTIQYVRTYTYCNLHT